MSYKVIASNPTIHDYRERSAHITHTCVHQSDTFMVPFAELETHGVRGIYRTALIIKVGDLMLKDMSSGRIGVYEVQSVMAHSVCEELGQPFVNYFVEMFLLGYKGDANTIEIFSGYGILKPKVEKPSNWFSRLFGG